MQTLSRFREWGRSLRAAAGGLRSRRDSGGRRPLWLRAFRVTLNVLVVMAVVVVALLGYLAATGERSEGGLRRAIVYGTVLASFVVEDFGGQRMRTLTRDDIERRYRQFVALTEF